MRKKIFFAVMAAAILATGCSKEKIPMYQEAEDYLEEKKEQYEGYKEQAESYLEVATGGPEAWLQALTGGETEEADAGEETAAEAKAETAAETMAETAAEPEAGTAAEPEAGTKAETTAETKAETAADREDSVPESDPFYMPRPEHYRNRNSIELIARFPVDDETSQLNFNSQIIFYPGSREGTGFLAGPDGKKALDYEIDPSRCEYFGDGYYIVAKTVPEGERRSDNGDIDRNTLGLIRFEGTTAQQILPCEYAGFDYLSRISLHSNNITHRFLKAYKVDEPTDDLKDYFMFFSNEMFRIMPEEGDFVYNGHWDLFDLSGKKFVPGITSEKADDLKIQNIGNAILVNRDGMSVLFDADGNELLKTSASVYMADGSLMVRGEEEYRIYDDRGNEMTCIPESEGELEQYILSESGYYKLRTAAGELKILDRIGHELFTADPSWEDTEKEVDGVCVFRDGEILVSPEGTLIGEQPKGLQWMNVQDTGYFDTSKNYMSKVAVEPDKFTWASRDGILVKDIKEKSGLNLSVKNDEGKYLVFKDGDFTLDGGTESTMIAPGLLRKSDGTDGFGLYDIFTGEELLPCSHVLVRRIGHMILAVDHEGIAAVYELTGPGLDRSGN